MTLKEKLSAIQQKMKAPKNLWNKFGEYYYRNAEGILEGFKPFEDKYKVMMIVQDEIVPEGDRLYVKATATVYDLESDEQLSATAYAREPENKKGMDSAQVTGTSSSYARKYALNGLLLLDDTKDPDSDENHIESEAKAEIEKLPAAMVKTLERCIPEHGQTIDAVCKHYKVKKLDELSVIQFKHLMDQMGENA